MKLFRVNDSEVSEDYMDIHVDEKKEVFIEMVNLEEDNHTITYNGLILSKADALEFIRQLQSALDE